MRKRIFIEWKRKKRFHSWLNERQHGSYTLCNFLFFAPITHSKTFIILNDRVWRIGEHSWSSLEKTTIGVKNRPAPVHSPWYYIWFDFVMEIIVKKFPRRACLSRQQMHSFTLLLCLFGKTIIIALDMVNPPKLGSLKIRLLLLL